LEARRFGLDDESWISTAKPCDPMSEDAKSWSVEGACIKASGGDKTAWASAKRHILAFSPKLGTDGREVTYDMVWNLLKGAYYHAYLCEMSQQTK